MLEDTWHFLELIEENFLQTNFKKICIHFFYLLSQTTPLADQQQPLLKSFFFSFNLLLMDEIAPIEIPLNQDWIVCSPHNTNL